MSILNMLRSSELGERGKLIFNPNFQIPREQPHIEKGMRLVAIIGNEVRDVTGAALYKNLWQKDTASLNPRPLIALYLFPGFPYHGIPKELVERAEPIFVCVSPCVGCGTGDYTKAALRGHEDLPEGSLVPLCEGCSPRIY